MTKQNPYSIGQPKRDGQFKDRRSNFKSNGPSRFNQSKDRNNFSRNNQYRNYNDKNKNIIKIFNPRGDRNDNQNDRSDNQTDRNNRGQQRSYSKPRYQRGPYSKSAKYQKKQQRSYSKPSRIQRGNQRSLQRSSKNRKYQKEQFNQDKPYNNKLKQQQLNGKMQIQQKKENVEKKQTNNVNGQKKQGKTQQKKIRHNRIIIRNLVFDINQKHIQKLLAPFGKVLEVNIPKNPDNKGSRGFAFVEFDNKNSCLKAIKELNGHKFKGRQIVLDESVSKQRYLQGKVTTEDKQNQNQQKVQQTGKKVKLQEKTKVKKHQDNNEAQQIQQQQAQNGQNEEEELQNQQEEQSQQIKQQQIKKIYKKSQQQIQKDISSQVFIRNLPINVTQEQLHKYFRRYGNIKFAKIVMNRQTKVSKGSAFIKFHDPKVANQLVQYSRNYEMNLLGKNRSFQVNPAINLQLQGTILKLFPAQSRQNISEKIKGRDQKDKQRQQTKADLQKKKKPIKKIKSLEKLIQYDPNDKRNLKLALLGLNKVSEEMRQKDQQRFKGHYRQKLQKLKNPNNSVSQTRIILKFLNKEITQADIKQLCGQYLEQSKNKAKDLTFCKLMLESLQSKKSAGYAFIQFRTHQIAAGFLEWIVQQQERLMKEPFICQFAIHDSRKLFKLKNKNKPGQSNQETKGKNNEFDKNGNKKISGKKFSGQKKNNRAGGQKRNKVRREKNNKTKKPRQNK